MPTLGNGFVNFDDYGYILQNPAIRSINVDLLKYAFGGFHFQFYIPFTWLSFAVDHYFWGLNPVGFHLTNNILHALNAGWVTLLTVQLYEIYFESLERDSLPQWRLLLPAIFAGLMFGVHPLRVESVAWATERKDVLCGFFALPAMLTYLKHVRRRPLHTKGCFGGWYIATHILFLCSLLSKPMLITLPVVLLLLDWFPLGRINGWHDLFNGIREKTFLIIMAVAATGTVLLSQLADGISLSQVALPSRVVLAFKSIIDYMRMMAWPSGLVPLYPHPGNEASLARPEYIFSVTTVVSITLFAVWRAIRKERVWLASWCYFLITLLPVLGITQVGPQAMADRFTYVPAIMPTILAAAILCMFGLSQLAAQKYAVSCGLLLLILSLLFSWGKVSRDLMGIWRDSDTFWSRVIKLRPMESADSYHHRGFFYADCGEYERALEDLNNCIIVSCRQPNKLSDAYAGRGDIHMRMGQFTEAYHDFTDAIVASSHPKPELYLWRDKALRLSTEMSEGKR